MTVSSKRKKSETRKTIPTNTTAYSSSDDISSKPAQKNPASLQNTSAKNIQNKKPEYSSSDDSSDSSDSSDEKMTVSKKSNGKAFALAKPAESEGSDSDDVDESSSDDDETSSDDDEAPPNPIPPAPKKSISHLNNSAASIPTQKQSLSSSDDDSETTSDEETTVPSKTSGPAPGAVEKNPTKKRKAEDISLTSPKKVKFADGHAASPDNTKEETKSIFVGRLSWNVDNDWLAQEFAECGEVVSATVQMDRNTGKSRGFGYVHFATAAAVEAALAFNGKEIDGRPINVDRSQPADKSRVRENRAHAFGDEASAPTSTLFVGNLSFGVAEDTLWEVFGEYGQVKNVRLPTDRETGRFKGFGYVEFDDVGTAKKAYEGAQGLDIGGRSIRLDFSQPRDANGSGGRGGFGNRGGHGSRAGFGDRGAHTRGRGRGGRGSIDRGGRGGRGGFSDRGGRGGARRGTIAAFEGRKTTFV